MDLGCDRVEQPGDQGRGPLPAEEGQAPDHLQDRTQGGAGHLPPAGARRLRGHLPRPAGRRPGRPRCAGGGHARRHHAGLADARQQRDRRDPGPRRDRRAVPRARHPVPRRRRAVGRQGADRPECTESGPDELLRAQDLRPQGHRCAVRAAQAARAPGGTDARWRARARHAFRHPGHAPDRRHG